MRGRAISLLLTIGLIVPGLLAQTDDRKLALTAYKQGLEHMRAEDLDKAGAAFETAVKLDRTFAMAYYMLGRVRMAQKRFVEASAAFSAARSLYQAAAGRNFANAREVQRLRRDQIIEIDELLRQLQTGTQTGQTQNQVRQLVARRRALQESIERGNDITLTSSVPAYVSLSYGSAQFRMGNLAEAEKAYREAIAADATTGEAHNNLAVVFLETGRFDEAERAIAAAEKAGFRVPAQLKEEVRNRRKAGRGGTR